MHHKTTLKIADIHPYEIVKVQLLPDKSLEKEWIQEISQQTKDYLTLTLQAVEIVEQEPPYFTIKKIKTNIGFGQ